VRRGFTFGFFSFALVFEGMPWEIKEGSSIF
jgi:hypothetical protein